MPQMEFICSDVVQHIMDYIDRELDYQTMIELEKHVDHCAECGVFVATYKKMLQLSGKLKQRTFVTPEVRERLKILLKSKIKLN